MPADGKRYELVKGVLREMPSPTVLHQRISRNLSISLHLFVREHKLGEVLTAPLDVHLGDDLSYQPDVLFVANESKARITDQDIEGAPDLVVEIISPSSSRIDRKEKLENYASYGVREYWLAYPDAGLIEVYGSKDGKFHVLGRNFEGETLKSQILPGLELAISTIFEE